MFKMHQPPELEETDNVSFYEADVSSDASSDASTDASSSESLPFEENSSTGRSSQEPARVPQGPRLPRSQSTPPDIRDLLPECSTSDLETTRPKSVSPESQTSCTSASSLPATEATMIKALHPDKYGLEEQWKEIVTTTRWNGGMALRALNRNPVTQCAASEPAPESDRKRKRESSSSDPDATEYSEGPGEGPSTGQGGSLARSKTSKGKQKQVGDSDDSSHQGGKKKKGSRQLASAKQSTKNKEDKEEDGSEDREARQDEAEAWNDWD